MTGQRLCNNRLFCIAAMTLFLAGFPFLCAQQVRSDETPPQEKSAKAGPAGDLSQNYLKEITRKGKTIIVTRMLADKMKADNSIVVSAITVKASVDKRGKGNGYRIVAVDRGSLAEKLGILKNDVIQEVNGLKLVSFDDINDAEARFKDATDLKVKVLRKGRVQILYYAVR